MYQNERFHLTEEQLQKLSDWSNNICQQYWQEDCGESFELQVIFQFSYFGRAVTARVENEMLELEDNMDDVLPPSKGKA